MRLMLMIPVLALAACVEKEKVPSGAEDFATFCSACHGLGGKGDGDAAATARRAHRLRGAASNYALHDLMALAQAIERNPDVIDPTRMAQPSGTMSGRWQM